MWLNQLGKMKRIVQLILLGTLVFVAVLLSQCQPATHSNNNIASNSLVFDRKVIDPSPPSGSNCCLDVLSIGDIDGDDKPDIMVGSENSLGAVWYHYPDWKRYLIGSGDFTTDGEIADVDGDKDGDVVISSISRDAIEWWENTGNPFEESGWIRHEIGAKFAHDLAVGDINSDGNLDVAMYRKDDPRQITWFEAPDNPQEKWIRHEIDTPAGEGLDLGDIDGDGDLDLAGSSNWYENQDSQGLNWQKHQVTSNWGADTRDIIADMNGDGKKDIILSHSEGEGRISWFENPNWTEHPIEPKIMKGVHSLEVGDFNHDGYPDVFAGEMNTVGSQVIVYENQGGDGNTWNPMILSTQGTHNARIGDIGADGDLDIVGKNYTGEKVVELWLNQTSKPELTLGDWTYIEVDNSRESYNEWVQYFGLAMGDLTGDGYGDIVSGRYFYRNPRGDMTGTWERVTFPINVDAVLIVDVDGDAMADIIGQALPDIYWLEAQDAQGNSWQTTKIGTIPQTSHNNGQGYNLAQIIPGGKPEIILAGGEGDRDIYYFEIPDKPSEGNWPRTLITNEATDEGIGIGDIDRDGDLDIAAGDMFTGGKKVGWWENPGNGQANWTKHNIGNVAHWPDRVAIADLNQDRRLDIIVSEENEGKKPNANVYWFEQPENPQDSDWQRHLLTTQYTTNSMDIADLDRDGAIDIITGEHRGTKKVKIWKNVNNGDRWLEYLVDQDKESHLGTRVMDLDGDGDLEIVSIAWDEYPYLHLWRNDAKKLSENFSKSENDS